MLQPFNNNNQVLYTLRSFFLSGNPHFHFSPLVLSLTYRTMGFLRLGSKKAKKDTTATMSPSFSSPDPLHIKLNKDEPPLLSSPIADNFMMSIPTENQEDPHGTIGKSLYEDIFSELNPSSSAMSQCEYLSLHQVYFVVTDNRVYTAKAPEEQQIMRESVEEASSIAESSSTSKGGVKAHSSAAASLPPAATTTTITSTTTTTISPTKPTPRPTRRRMFKQHRSSVPDSDASDSDASSSSTAITSESVGSLKAFDHTTKHKITPETLMARMRERHRQECRKSWMPSSPPTATEQHHKPTSGAGFYRTASPSMPVMYPANPMMLPLAHESMQHQHVHPGIVRSASTFSGFYHPLDHHHQPHPSLQLRPLNNQGLPVRAIPPMSPPLSPITPMSSPPPMTSMPQQQQHMVSPMIAQQDHQPLLLKQPSSSPPPLSKRHHHEDDDDDQNQDASLKQEPIQEDTPADEGDTTTFLVDRDVQTDEDYHKRDESMTPPPNMEEDSKADDKVLSPSSVQSHEDNLKNDNGGGSGGGVRQVVPLGETMPVVLVSESETGAKQYYLLLPQQYGETLQQELQQQRQQSSSPQSSCCNADVSSCTKGSPCPHQRHRHHHHHHHHCSHHSNHRRSSSPSNNHCSQHRRHHHCCRRPTTGSGSSRADSIISSAQRSSV